MTGTEPPIWRSSPTRSSWPCSTGYCPNTQFAPEQDPFKFTSLTRRERAKAGYLVDDTTGVEVPLGRLARWYKAQNSPLRIEHRWTTDDGTVHKTTPPEARGIRLLMDLPDHPPADLDIGWYVAQARKQILANRHFEHLDPKWLEGHAGPLDLHNKGLVPCPKWDGKKLPKGAEVRQPSFFWRWDAYESFATYTGAAVGILASTSTSSPSFASGSMAWGTIRPSRIAGGPWTAAWFRTIGTARPRPSGPGASGANCSSGSRPATPIPSPGSASPR